MAKKNINCPRCGAKDTWQDTNAFRPFCSERCKLIDLGDWASEKNAVPGEPVDPQQLTNNSEDEE